MKRRTRLDERKNWCQRSTVESLVASVLAVALAFLIRFALHTYLDDGIPTFTFVIATIFIASRYGWRYGMLTLVTGFIIATYFFIKPYNTFDLPSEEDLYRMFYYFSVATLIVIVFEKNNRSEHESELLATKSDERYRAMVSLDKKLRDQIFID